MSAPEQDLSQPGETKATDNSKKAANPAPGVWQLRAASARDFAPDAADNKTRGYDERAPGEPPAKRVDIIVGLGPQQAAPARAGTGAIEEEIVGKLADGTGRVSTASSIDVEFEDDDPEEELLSDEAPTTIAEKSYDELKAAADQARALSEGATTVAPTYKPDAPQGFASSVVATRSDSESGAKPKLKLPLQAGPTLPPGAIEAPAVEATATHTIPDNRAPSYARQPTYDLPQYLQSSQHSYARLRTQRTLDEARAARTSQRVQFLRLTYLHLLGAILAFAGLEWLLLANSTVHAAVATPIIDFAQSSRFHWLFVLAGFVGAGWLAETWARSGASRSKQYLGLGLYIVAEAIIFLPLLYLAQVHSGGFLAAYGHESHIIRDAGLLTVFLFSGLTLSAFVTRRDFSFLRGGLMIGGSLAMGMVVMAVTMGFNLGMLFSAAMIVLAAGYVLYFTSCMFHRYRATQYVAASLGLFAAIALMFWYMVRMLIKLRE